jgi:hypothetical protein
MNKKYRNEYKAKLIKKGLIQPETPIDEEPSKTTQTNIKNNDNSDNDDEDENMENEDDFFEKA